MLVMNGATMLCKKRTDSGREYATENKNKKVEMLELRIASLFLCGSEYE
jgi:hypothetical protein